MVLVGGALVALRAGGESGIRGVLVPEPPSNSEREARTTAQRFLRFSIDAKTSGQWEWPCGLVVDQGGVVNRCMADLSHRNDLASVTRLDPKVSVRHATIRGNRAVVTPSDLHPSAPWKLSVTMYLTKEGWRVRVLNGRPIRYIMS